MNGNVLIIADEPLTICIINEALKTEGYTIREIADGRAGTMLMATNSFDLVIVDITLPVLKDLNLARTMQAGEPLAQMIVLTRSDTMNAAQALVEAGAFDYFVIPDDIYRIDRLRLMARNAIEKRRMSSRLKSLMEKNAKPRTGRGNDAIIHDQKMSGLAGCIAHDFNNLLTTMIGNATWVRTRLHMEDPLYEPVKHIQEAGDRANELVKQLLAFNRSETLHLERLPLSDVISHLEPLLQQAIYRHTDLRIEVEPSTEPMLIDRMQLEQIIMNLVVNARDAMPDGGRLTLRAKAVSLDEQEAHRQAVSPGRYMQLEVEDTGVGMDEMVQTRIFETFFTTKKSGRGNGVGLSTVHNIVVQSGGTIQVSSAPDKGTTFSIYLPVMILPDYLDDHASEQKDVYPATVLVVDDEQSVRTFAQKILEQADFTVLEASNGVEALERLKEYDGPVTLVVTDVQMPKMDGNAFVKELQQKHPETKTIFISGLPEPIPIDKSLAEDQIPLLTKPFGVNELLGCVRETLAYPDSRTFKGV